MRGGRGCAKKAHGEEGTVEGGCIGKNDISISQGTQGGSVVTGFIREYVTDSLPTPLSLNLKKINK